MAKGKKYYVVWVGQTPGVYDNWNAAQSQIRGFPDAKYKSFKTREAAEAAYEEPWEVFYGEGGGKGKKAPTPKLNGNFPAEVVRNSIAVDAACSGNPGIMEYRGVETFSGAELFHSPKFPVGTNNIGEFLALVHALAMFSKSKPDLTIYSDSRIAMGWVFKKKCKTNLPRNARTAKLYEVMERAEKWLKTNTFKNPIKKWETKAWGEIPADFGRK